MMIPPDPATGFSGHQIAPTGVQTAIVCMSLVLSMERMLLYEDTKHTSRSAGHFITCR
jgi:hypothetical protein